MKKISLILLSCVITQLAFAQLPKFGLKAGLNISNTSNTVGGTSGTRLGLHAGLLSHIHLSPEWSLQPEVVYSGQGAKVGDVNLNLSYINIPLLVQYNFNNGFRLQTGPQLGFLIDVQDNVNATETNYFSKNDFNSTDVAWSFGLGYLSETGFGIDGRYNLGITNVRNPMGAGAGKTTSRVFQLGVFYMLDNSHKRNSR